MAEETPSDAPRVLVTVSGGVADVHTQGSVHIAVVDFDSLVAGDPPVQLEADIWNDLAQARGLEPGRDIHWL
jgi:hypothetical protein